MGLFEAVFDNLRKVGIPIKTPDFSRLKVMKGTYSGSQDPRLYMINILYDLPNIDPSGIFDISLATLDDICDPCLGQESKSLVDKIKMLEGDGKLPFYYQETHWKTTGPGGYLSLFTCHNIFQFNPHFDTCIMQYRR